ncbi:MAG: hypothetical protein SO129_01155 [Anaerovibrio sp.]|nr:hypothetical protein [Anaerovibrio sp.]
MAAGDKKRAAGGCAARFLFAGAVILIRDMVFYFAGKYGKLIIIRPEAVLLWYLAVLVARFVDDEIYILGLGVLCYDVFEFPGREARKNAD